MRALFVKPYQIVNEIQPPLGLGYLASSIRGKHKVKILDCIKENIKSKKFRLFIKKNKFDIICFQCYTIDINTVKKLSRIIKELNSRIITIVGGPHPTLDPFNILKYLKDIDYAFKGEAEIGLPILLNNLKKRKINLIKVPGLVYRSRKKIKINSPKYPENLDDFNPAWDLYDLKSYPLAPHGAFFKKSPIAPIIITRGCPFQCDYCGGPIISGRKIRSHSVDFVIQQIEMLNKKYEIKEIHIEDDNFTMNRKFVEDFCKKLINKNLEISWTCPNGIRIDTVNLRLLKLMKKSGLYSISLGIESGSDRIRRKMKKNLSTEKIVEKVQMVHKAGIGMIGFFIVGYPGETKKDIQKTIDFACSLPLKRATFSAFKPFPGTPIYNELVRENKIKKLEPEKFSLDKAVWAPEGIKIKELKNLRRKAFIKFYFRPKIIFCIIKEINNLENLKYILIRIFRWMT